MKKLTIKNILAIWPEKNPGDYDMPDFYEGKPSIDSVIIDDHVCSDAFIRFIDIVDGDFLWNVHIHNGHIVGYGREMAPGLEHSTYLSRRIFSRMVADIKRLNWLDEHLINNSSRVIYVHPYKDRGWQLQETTQDEAPDNIRDAIDDAIEHKRIIDLGVERRKKSSEVRQEALTELVEVQAKDYEAPRSV